MSIVSSAIFDNWNSAIHYAALQTGRHTLWTDNIKEICAHIHEYVMRFLRALQSYFHPTPPISNARDPLNLIAFYRGQEANNRGVRIDEIWRWDNQQLESVHDYIQWLFPLKEPTSYNPTAPLLTEETIRTFRNDPGLQNKLLRSFRHMLSFYGLQIDETTKVISRSPEFVARKAVWLVNPAGHHNFLRITRIIHSLKLLGLSEYSQAFFRIMQNISQNEGNGIIPPTTLRFWQNAAFSTS